MLAKSPQPLFRTRRCRDGFKYLVIAGAAAVFLLSFVSMRTQSGIGNSEFLRAMIPHHSGAILMCGKAKLSDQELVALCAEIVEAQKREIRQMQAIQDRL